ncbi:MAG: YggS family pyridoxal phosphate-dependent enzyme, partial [Acidimicrobiia bacterium]
MHDVVGALLEVRRRLGASARRSGRPPDAVRLVAVTKGVDVAVMAAALDAGVTDLGESRAQEMLAKAPELAGRAPVWHFVGRIQRNKAGALAPLVACWHGVDRVEVGAAVARRSAGASVYVQVNVDEDPA